MAEKLASGAITPEAAGLILDAEGPVDHGVLLEAAEEEPEDRFRRTLKEHVNDRTSEQELQERRARQRRRRRASITEQPDGMFHLFAQLDPLVGNQVRAALVAKADALFRSEDSKDRATPPQRFADALAQLICTNTNNNGHGNSGGGVSAGVELIVLADYDQVAERITNGPPDQRHPPHRSRDPGGGLRRQDPSGHLQQAHRQHPPGMLTAQGPQAAPQAPRGPRPRLHRLRCLRADLPGPPHQVHWNHGGETSYHNTCLLCWRCHQIRVHQHGEEITRHPNGTYTLAPPATSSAERQCTRWPPPPREPSTHPPPTDVLAGYT